MNDTNIQLYLSEIAKTPLLSPSEERSLARKIDITRATWTGAVARDWHGSQMLLDALENVLDGSWTLDRVVSIDRQDPLFSRLDAMPRIANAVKSIRAIRERIESLSYLRGRKKDIARHTRAMLALFRELGIRTSIYRSCADCLRYTPGLALDALDRYESYERDMIEANLRLVVSIAKSYRDRGADFVDLIQEGSLGLMRAVDKFDYRRGISFATLATWWIKQAIMKLAAEGNRTIRVPVHMVDLFGAYSRAVRSVEYSNNRSATIEEVAEAMGLTVDEVQRVEDAKRRTVSLDMPTRGSEDSSVGDLVEDGAAECPSGPANRALLSERLGNIFSTLTQREREIVKLRFGIGYPEPATLGEIGVIFSVTRERVRQLIGRAIRKLQHPIRRTRLEGFLDSKIN